LSYFEIPLAQKAVQAYRTQHDDDDNENSAMTHDLNLNHIDNRQQQQKLSHKHAVHNFNKFNRNFFNQKNYLFLLLNLLAHQARLRLNSKQ